MKCLLFGHSWKEVGRERYIDISWGKEPRTEFRLRCERCGERKVKRLSGHWSDGE